MNNKLKKKTIESTHGGDWTVLIILLIIISYNKYL